jgi:hypothetical protein
MFTNLAAKPSETFTSLGTAPNTQPQAGANAFKPLGTSTLTTPPVNQSGFTLGGPAATGDKAASTTVPGKAEFLSSLPQRSLKCLQLGVGSLEI